MRVSPKRAMTLDEAVAFVAAARASGQRIGFTNGVFDLLHPGHVQYLAAARALVDVLIVGVNSDASVRAIKGPSRPVNPEVERAEVLLALDPVDAVVVFDAETPIDLIRTLQPDVLVKGADWRLDAIVGREETEARGGRVVRIPLVEGLSSSELLRRVRAADRPRPA